MPRPLPDVGSDFDWTARDFDGFRRFMLEELAARVPERTRWTPADVEVALVEALAAHLDQLSDMADRTAAEAYLETARRPDSVRRLLAFVGWDAALDAWFRGEIDVDPREDRARAEAALDRLWLDAPRLMEVAKRAGVRDIHALRRIVTAEDAAALLARHPLVRRASGFASWSGTWTRLHVALLGWNERPLDEPIPAPGAPGALPDDLRDAVDALHALAGVAPADWTEPVTLRAVLHPFAEAHRLAGHELVLEDVRQVGVHVALTVQLAPWRFQEEVRAAVAQVLGTEPGAFFAPGRLRFGEDLHASDVIDAVMAIDGVTTVTVDAFRRIDPRFADQTSSGRIVIEPLEVAVCLGDPTRPAAGALDLELVGGIAA